ncbi:SGNH/GDSL hydrolase family protein [Gordonia sp. CPCC 206044]|uniref:SGNH/GDSL hydrolase family protein n=1 Tax=Gordonia sp. CPCC 206044 TaxID=3140793 RepID=UPI003AF36D95
MRRPAPRLTAAVTLLVVALLAVGCASDDGGGQQVSSPSPSPSSAPAVPVQINLGDSYSAAAGVPPLVEGSSVLCLRSSRNAAHLLAGARGYRLDDVSCSGADTGDLFTAQYDGVPAQLDAVTADADLVTLMIGGNDSGVYTNAIRACSDVADTDPTGSPCQDRHGSQFVDIVDKRTYPALIAAFRAVRAKAPRARVLVIGYPWILPATGGCRPAVGIATGDVPYLRNLQAVLNDAIERAAGQTGVTYVDMSGVSDGHDACAPPGRKWVEPQTGATGAAPLHPNEAGQQAIADQVSATLGG